MRMYTILLAHFIHYLLPSLIQILLNIPFLIMHFKTPHKLQRRFLISLLHPLFLFSLDKVFMFDEVPVTCCLSQNESFLEENMIKENNSIWRHTSKLKVGLKHLFYQP